jgi:hypothetical protein
MLIFLITVLGFVPFSFDPASPQFRAQVTGLLLLTSVNFRWIITQRLPSVPYLTSLDKYAIGSLLFLVIFCVWHSLIGSSVITTTNKKEIDTYVLYGLATSYIVFNVILVSWLLKMGRTIQIVKEQCQLKTNVIEKVSPKELASKNQPSFSTKSDDEKIQNGVLNDYDRNRKYSSRSKRPNNVNRLVPEPTYLVQSA